MCNETGQSINNHVHSLAECVYALQKMLNKHFKILLKSFLKFEIVCVRIHYYIKTKRSTTLHSYFYQKTEIRCVQIYNSYSQNGRKAAFTSLLLGMKRHSVNVNILQTADQNKHQLIMVYDHTRKQVIVTFPLYLQTP